MCEASDGGPSVWRRIVVTGANKGIGLAICRKLLTDAEDTFVYLGARDQNRGDAAAKTLVEANPVWGGRVAVLLVDVTNAASVQSAAATLRVAGVTLFGVVNNAGGFLPFREMLQLHLYGARRVTEALAGMLEDRGRLVYISSGGAPACAAKCREDRRALLSSPDLTWEQIDGLARDVLVALKALPGDADDSSVLAATGVAWGLGGYGFSKALVNCYAAWVQRDYPGLIVNACNPGLIDTDLSRPYAVQSGKTPAELGMLPVEQGAVVPCKLLLEEVAGRGAYYDRDGTLCGFADVDPNDFES